MATLLALISSLLWGSADFEAGRLSKRYPALVVLGISQIIGLFTGIIIIIISGDGLRHLFQQQAISFLEYVRVSLVI